MKFCSIAGRVASCQLYWITALSVLPGVSAPASPLALAAQATAGAPVLVESVTPAAGSAVRELLMVDVQFSQAVRGVDAGDLLLNGIAANAVREFASGQFVFTFDQPQAGAVSVSWRPDHGIVDAATGVNAFTGGRWNYELDTSPSAAQVYISEFMADNRKTLRDEDGDNSDWIEFYNPEDVSVALGGWFLTDDANNLAKWQFPTVTIGPREFLIVFASEKNRTNVTGPLHTNFKLSAEGEYLALVSPQTNVLSQYGPPYPPQAPDVSYGRVPGSEAVGYFPQSTPGAPNSDSGTGFAPTVSFSRSGSSFSAPFELRLSGVSTNAIVHYSLDGSLPSESSSVYGAPLVITNSVQVRARAFQAGLLPGPPRSETYLLLSSNVMSFTSDLPVLVIHSLGKGAPTASRQTFAQISVFEPLAGITSLTNRPTLNTRSGIKVRGSSTEGLPKPSLAVEFWDEFNQDKAEEILGLPAESDWVLYAPDSFEPVLIHNPFIHQLSRDMGRYSPRTKFVEVYLNKASGPISDAHYFGIYVLEEKIKIGPHRVAIDKLQPQDLRSPEVTGGYLLKIDRLDPGDSGLSAGGQTMAYIDPKEREIRLAQRNPQAQYIKNYFNNFSRALNSSTWTNPVQGYAAFIDVSSWIDFHVIELLSGNVDALVLSTYFHKPRDGKIIFGPHWDFDRALGSTDGRDANPRNWITGPFFTGWWARLFRDPDFWQKWIDRYQELRLAQFSQAYINGLIDSLADEVRQAQPRERQRWHVGLRGGSYQAEVNLMKNWLSNRTVFIDHQLVAPPQLSAAGGAATPGFTLSLAGPTNAVLFYTLDGTDPRLSQGTLSPNARIYDAPLTIASNVRVVARARNLNQRQTGGPLISSPWSGPASATFTVMPPPLLLTELMFNPAGNGTSPTTNAAPDFSFLELKNVSSQSVKLAGYHFTAGIDFRFDQTSSLQTLAPGARLVVVRDLNAFRVRYPNVTNVAGQLGGSLSRSGGRLTLVGPLEEPVFDLTYSATWQPLADGLGFSLVLTSEAMAPAEIGAANAWRLSARPGGSPGEIDPPPPILSHVLVNELLPNPLANGRDSVELFNPEAQPADISGWYLSDDFRNPRKVRLPGNLVLDPGGYSLLDSSSTATGNLGFSKFGEGVYLFSADAAGNLTGWVHGFKFGASELGVSFGRYLKSTGEASFVAQREPSLGRTNTGPRVGPIAITEVNADQFATITSWDVPSPYIELRNSSSVPVALFDPSHPTNSWRIRGTVDFEFPAGTMVGAGAYVVLVDFDPGTDSSALARFQSRYGLSGAARLFGPWRGELGSNADTIRLLKPGELKLDASSGLSSPAEILVEELNDFGLPLWPDASGQGRALVRRDLASLADDPINWMVGRTTPGRTDTDGDGLPDAWEIENGLNPSSSAESDGPEGDPDSDGFSSLAEFLSGTNPRNAESAWTLQAALTLTGEVELTFLAVPGRKYTVEVSDRLGPGPWKVLQALIGPANGDSITFRDRPAPATPVRFYRLRTP